MDGLAVLSPRCGQGCGIIFSTGVDLPLWLVYSHARFGDVLPWHSTVTPVQSGMSGMSGARITLAPLIPHIINSPRSVPGVHPISEAASGDPGVPETRVRLSASVEKETNK